MPTEARQITARLWPHLRALFIAFHVIAVIVLSLPSPSSVGNRGAWNTANNKRAMAIWAERLSWLGYQHGDELEADLWDLTQSYIATRRTFIRPFQRYADVTGSYQGWRMFAVPQRHPAEMHIDIRESAAGGSPGEPADWRPIYRPHSDEYAYWRSELTHNRLRKTQGRFARSNRTWLYHLFADFLAIRVARDHPGADEIRFRLYRYPTRTPEQVRAGQPRAGRYTDERRFRADLLRAGEPPARARIPVPGSGPGVHPGPGPRPTRPEPAR